LKRVIWESGPMKSAEFMRPRHFFFCLDSIVLTTCMLHCNMLCQPVLLKGSGNLSAAGGTSCPTLRTEIFLPSVTGKNGRTIPKVQDRRTEAIGDKLRCSD